MGCLYLTQSGARLSRTGRRIILAKDDQEMGSWPIHHIDRILAFGRIQITADALSLLLAKGVHLCLFTSRGRFRGSLVPPGEERFRLQQRLYLLTADPQYPVCFARTLVAAKLLSSRSVLQRYQANHPEITFCRTIFNLHELSEKAKAADNMDGLRGLEGMGARLYFAEWPKIFTGAPFTFEGRVRRPPRDPINSILSFSYVLLTGMIQGLLLAHDLDPWAGFYHSNVRSAPALTLDILEEFRQPVADRFVFYCIHKNVLTPSDFETLLNGQVTLASGAKKKFLTRWEEWLNLSQRWERHLAKMSAIELIHRQIDRLTDALLKGVAYFPFVLEA